MQTVSINDSGTSIGKHANTVQVSIRGSQYVKNYLFDFNFGNPWGTCSVTMTSVIGHLTSLDFESHLRSWASCPPGALFEAPVQEFVANVCHRYKLQQLDCRH